MVLTMETQEVYQHVWDTFRLLFDLRKKVREKKVKEKKKKRVKKMNRFKIRTQNLLKGLQYILGLIQVLISQSSSQQ